MWCELIGAKSENQEAFIYITGTDRRLTVIGGMPELLSATAGSSTRGESGARP